jgi:hypothetical protein
MVQMNLNNPVQPRMYTDGHGLKTGCIDERLHAIVNHSFFLDPCLSVFIRGFFKFKSQVPELGFMPVALWAKASHRAAALGW